MGRRTRFVDSDILVVGGGFGGCGAAYEARYWGRDLNVVVVEKANVERSGAVAQDFPRSIATWACNGAKISPRIS
jgi:adenylylsulfate reductase subunit A